MSLDYMLSIDAYHALTDSVSKTWLDDINLSPWHCYARHLDPKRPAPKEKQGQLEGNLAHCAILEPNEFNKRYVVGPSVNRNTKIWKSFVDENPGRIAIQVDQYDAAMRQAESVRSLPDVRDALDRGRPEVSAFWTDPETGVRCRCRPDWVHECDESGVIELDVKTYSSASANEFRRQVARKRYDVQAAFYSEGYAAASDRIVLGFVFVAVETDHPFAANAFMLDEDSIESGRQKYLQNLRTYAECARTNTWPGYSTGIDIIRLPQWALLTED